MIAFTGHIFYNLFLHPLRNYPGPLLWRATSIPAAYWHWQGKIIFKISEIHDKYGTVVRIMPNELAFIGPEAWNDIYGHRKTGESEFAKQPSFYQPTGEKHHSVVYCGRAEHAALRRALSHGFSDRSMREQEATILTYVDLLVQRLNERSKGEKGGVINMREWFNYTTFDLIGELGFNSSFDCLAQSDYHPWIRAISETVKSDAILRAMQYLGMPTPLSVIIEKFRLRNDPRKQHANLMVQKVSHRRK